MLIQRYEDGIRQDVSLGRTLTGQFGLAVYRNNDGLFSNCVGSAKATCPCSCLLVGILIVMPNLCSYEFAPILWQIS